MDRIKNINEPRTKKKKGLKLGMGFRKPTKSMFSILSRTSHALKVLSALTADIKKRGAMILINGKTKKNPSLAILSAKIREFDKFCKKHKLPTLAFIATKVSKC